MILFETFHILKSVFFAFRIRKLDRWSPHMNTTTLGKVGAVWVLSTAMALSPMLAAETALLQELEGAGAEVWYHESPIEHWIDPQVITQVRALPFLADSG